MSKLFKELSIIEWYVSDNKNIYVVNVRNVNKTQEQKKFDSLDEAMKYYKSLDSVKSVAPKKEHKQSVAGENLEKLLSTGLKKDVEKLIIEYVKSNPEQKGVKSARYLNKRFDIKLKQEMYNTMFKGL